MNLETYQLMHPELLSKEILIDVLEQKCIEFSRGKDSSKSDLVEIFKRVALPLPQRQCDDEKYFSRKISNLRNIKGIPTGVSEHKHNLVKTTTCETGSGKVSNCIETNRIKERLKPPIENGNTNCKKIRLSNLSPTPKDDKRKNEEVVSICKKRQKITWP